MRDVPRNCFRDVGAELSKAGLDGAGAIVPSLSHLHEEGQAFQKRHRLNRREERERIRTLLSKK